MVGVLDENKAILSPAGAWLWAELGNLKELKEVQDFEKCERRKTEDTQRDGLTDNAS